MDLKFKDNSKLKPRFTQLEYIESTGTQYIDTGISIKDIACEIKCNLSSRQQYSTILGGYQVNVVNESLAFSDNNKLQIYLSNFNSYDRIISSNDFVFNSIHTIKVSTSKSNFKLQIDDYIIGDRTHNIDIPENYNAKVIGIDVNNCYCIGKFYYIKIYTNNNLVRNFIPALDTNSVVCMYDTVSGQFFYNQGTGNFVAGPVVNPGLPANILLKTTTLYHKNTPNVDGLQLLNSILNYQKTHQEEIKEYYYPTTQLWQDIITEYPDIVQYYDMNHKLCVYICEADDPEQCAEDFLQAIEDNPDIVDIFVDYPDLIRIIVGNPSLTPTIAENPEVVHSLIDTGYITYITNTSGAYIDTGKNPANPKISICFRVTTGRTDFDYFGNSNIDGSFICCDIENTVLAWLRWGSSNSINTSISCPLNTFSKLEFSGNLVIKQNDTIAYQGTHVYTKSNSQTNIVVFKSGRGNNSVYDLSEFIIEDGSDKLWLVPIQNNGNPCMIDLLTGTKYLNQGTGSFTYSLEPKNA